MASFKDMSDVLLVENHQFACRGFFKALSTDFLWELKLSDTFVSSALAS